MISYETPTDESLQELRTDLRAGITTLGHNHEADMVATHLMNVLGPDWNQTGVEGNPEFLTGPYWSSIAKVLSEAERKNPLSAPDAVSGIHTNEFILAEELGNAGYTASEAAAVILRMREKENMRQDMLHTAAQVEELVA